MRSRRWEWISVGIFGLSLLIQVGSHSVSAQSKSRALVQKKASPSKVSFANDIAPILKANCIACHSGEDIQAGLDLTKPESWFKAGLVKKGQPAQSELLNRIKGAGGLPQMPMGFKPLSPDKIKMVETWIQQGAVLDSKVNTHWAFVAPSRPKVPTVASKWIRNEIDAFVLEKMLQQGLQPNATATKQALIRRASLDVIGLPPTVEEVEAFVNDPRPDAYERLIDRLLLSPHYGERQARVWLDLARYADSNGYEKDRIRTAYLFRDWVIQAFNSNMPFSQFTIDQLAGDMLPNPTVEQLVATGFHRNTMFNEEGGVNPAESQYNTITDRVGTTSAVWMGATLQCSRCHDHKYDPFSQKDFFRMYAIFNNGEYRVEGDYTKSDVERWVEPNIKVLPQNVRKSIESLKSEEQLKWNRMVQQASRPETKERNYPGVAESTAIQFDQMKATSGASFRMDSDGLVVSEDRPVPTDIYTLEGPFSEGYGLILEAIASDGKPVGKSGGNFLLTGIEVKIDGVAVQFYDALATFTQSGYDSFEVLRGNRESGWAVYPKTKENHRLGLAFGKKLQGQRIQVLLRFESPYSGHQLRSFRVLPATEPDFLKSFLLPASDNLDPKEAALYGKRVGTEASPFWIQPEVLPQIYELKQSRRQIQTLENQGVEAMILREKKVAGPIKAPIYHRGEFASPKGSVDAGVPRVLLGKRDAANRLEFARWLVDRSNPLTARVTVNRIWEQYFGRGIVETVEDFGTQGARPSHAKLLDWLAVEFMDSGWDQKRLHKKILMSSTYRQSSAVTPRKLEQDPYNVFLSRSPRFRLEAEMIRDSALRASGLLSTKIGGPSVMPYQPKGVWDSPYNGEQWMEAQNEDRYRRGIYVFAKRTSMYPSFMALDAGTREVCVAKRTRTNTPLQALTLMNDRAFFEAAQALGRQIRNKGIDYGFYAVLSRQPSSKEKAILNQSLQRFRERYQKQPGEAKKIASDVEGAACTMLANVLLNLDEALTKQ